MWPEEQDTRELIASAREGSRDAIDRLLERHREALRRLIALRLDRKLQARVDASDVVQEVLLDASRRLDEYLRNPESAEIPFHLWLRRIALDRVLDAHRRHRRAGRRSVDREERPQAVAVLDDRSTLDLWREIADPRLTPARAAMENELVRRFQAALEELPEADREVLLMRHFEHLSNQEVARALGLSEAAAGMRYVRALRRVRGLLEPGAAGQSGR